MRRPAGMRRAWLGRALGPRAAVLAAVAVALGAGAALTLAAEARVVSAAALALAVPAMVAAAAGKVGSRRLPHTGRGWDACPACGARTRTAAALTGAGGSDRATVASVAVVGLIRFSCQRGLRPALQCELVDALGAVSPHGELCLLPGDRVALLSPRAAEDLRAVLEAVIERANRTLRGGFVAAGLASAGRAGLAQAFERADAAMRGAVFAGNTAVVASARPSRRPVMTQDGADAVRDLVSGVGAIAVAYQPVVELATGRLLGYEALMRPRGGQLESPTLAFDVAGGAGLVAALDFACRQAVLSDAPGLDMRRGELLFVNVAPQAFAGPEARPDELAAAVRKAGLEPEQVVLEVREDRGTEPRDLVAAAASYRACGFRLALDDVGGDASRLETLWRLRVDFLKLDESLTGQAPLEPAAQAVFQSLCALAAQVGSTLVAEGVENERLLRFVRAIDGVTLDPLTVHAAQGYQLGKPAPRPLPVGEQAHDADGSPAPSVADEAAASSGSA